MPIDIKGKFIDSEMTTDAELSVVENKFDSIFNDTKEPTGHLDRTQSSMSFDESTRTLSISPISGSFIVYVKGVKFEITSTLSVQIPNTSGNYFFYIDGNGTLNYYFGFNPLVLTDVAYTAFVHWNATIGQTVAFGEERHGTVMDGVTHSYLHTTRGTQLVSGAAISYVIGDGSLLADSQIGIANMQLKDEDITANIAHSSNPSSAFQQVLSPIAYLPVHYRDGSEWVKSVANSYPMLVGSNRSKYNYFNGSTWSLVESDTNGKVLVSYIFGTTNITEPVIALIGQDQYATLEDAKSLAAWDKITFGDLPAQEMKLLYIIYYETSSSFNNASKSKIVYVSDVRYSVDRQVSATVFNGAHGNLSGLENDDHSQYYNQTRLDPLITSAKDRANHTGTQLASTISDFTSAVQAVNIDASKIDGGVVDNTEFSYLNGVTSSIQTQLNNKQPIGAYLTGLSGDVNTIGSPIATASLSDTGVVAGTYDQVTVDTKGRVTSAVKRQWTYISTTATTSSSITYGAVTGLVTDSLPLGVYNFKIIGRARTAATNTGIGIRLASLGALTTTHIAKFLFTQAANGTASNFQYDQLNATTNVTSASVSAANTDFVVWGEGMFRVTLAGSMRVELRTETAGSNVTLQPDTILIIDAI